MLNEYNKEYGNLVLAYCEADIVFPLELKFKQQQQRSEGLEKEQTALVENFAEERSRLQKEENRLRKNLRVGIYNSPFPSIIFSTFSTFFP